MQYTENLKLKKPDPADNYNVKDFNENADILEKALTTVADILNNNVGPFMNKTSRIDKVTFTASGWSSSAPYTQTVNLASAKAQAQPEVYPDGSGLTTSNAEAYYEAYSLIGYITCGNGTITATAYWEKPTVDIPILVKGAALDFS